MQLSRSLIISVFYCTTSKLCLTKTNVRVVRILRSKTRMSVRSTELSCQCLRMLMGLWQSCLWMSMGLWQSCLRMSMGLWQSCFNILRHRLVVPDCRQSFVVSANCLEYPLHSRAVTNAVRLTHTDSHTHPHKKWVKYLLATMATMALANRRLCNKSRYRSLFWLAKYWGSYPSPAHGVSFHVPHALFRGLFCCIQLSRVVLRHQRQRELSLGVVFSAISVIDDDTSSQE